ncbi:MAG: alpha-glucosidase C-terminal domain-containing protein, partial [Candidatus Acidiferrum sp.]
KLGWPLEKGRDGERTPMQWNDSANAGFSTVKPWLPVPASASTHNVADETKDPDSVLSFYRTLLELRHSQAALLDGDYVSLNENNPNVLTYLRRYNGEAILVILNMSATVQKVPFDLSEAGFSAPKLEVLLTSFHKRVKGMFAQMPMEPYSVFIAKVTK